MSDSGEKRNSLLRAIFDRMPASMPIMQRYTVIAEVTRSSQIAVRTWMAPHDSRSIPQIKLEAVQAAFQKYGSSLQKKVGQHATTP
jgi:hypothetical protein